MAASDTHAALLRNTVTRVINEATVPADWTTRNGRTFGAHTYVLGCIERRVTVYSQQVRALNLIYALFHEQVLAKGQRLAVIGSGVAGLTAAAGAAIRGCSVTVLERHGHELPLPRNNHSRWIHPHILDWPHPGSEMADAGLPILDWSAAYAGDLASRLLEEWERLKIDHEITVTTGVNDLMIQAADRSGRLLTWNTPKGFSSARFDVVILAVGFGVERQLPGVPFVSYWYNDSLGSFVVRGPLPRRYLVTGCGDGGLIDLLRIRLADFRHDQIIGRLVSPDVSDPTLLERHRAELATVKKQLLEIESSLPPGGGSDDLALQYDAIEAPLIDAWLQKRLRHDTTATLNGPEPTPINRTASILNRFLVSRMMRMGVRYKQGHITRVTPAHPSGYDVEFDSGEVQQYDELVVRHGAESALRSGFPEIASAYTSSRRSEDTRGRAPEPIWTDDFFPPKQTKSARFGRLLDQGDLDQIRQFLAKTPEAFSKIGRVDSSRDSVRLVSDQPDLAADLALGEYIPSLKSQRWVLIRLLDPNTPPFDAHGAPSPALEAAAREVLAAQAHLAKDPSCAAAHLGNVRMSEISRLVLVGRRSLLDATGSEALRAYGDEYPGVRFRTYDVLVEGLREKQND